MTALRPHQIPHAEKLLAAIQSRSFAIDGSDGGVGKTYCGAWIAANLKVKTLIICPLSVVSAWEDVLPMFGVQATVINYESAWRRLGSVVPYGAGSFFKFTEQWPLIIYDEVHRAGGDTTINSKMLIAGKRQRSKILLLSATAASTVLKMKAIGFALNIHAISDYRMWLFAQGVREETQKLKNGRTLKKLKIDRAADATAMAKLHERIFGQDGCGSRLRIADIPNFPKTQIEIRLIRDVPASVAKLSDELQAFYRQRNVMAAITKDELAQIVFYRQAAEIAKIDLTLDMVQDALETSRCAVFVNFNRTVDELVAGAQKRGWTTGVIRGGDTDRPQTIADFQANKIDLIVCNSQAGGVGLSLHDPITQVPRTSIVYPTWRAEDLKQVFFRVARDGGGFSRQFFLCWESGIEKRVAGSVRRKLDNLSLLNDSELDGSFDGETEPSEPQLALAPCTTD